MITLEYVRHNADLSVSAMVDFDGLSVNYFLNADASEEYWMETASGTVLLSPTPQEMTTVRAVVFGKTMQ